MARKDAVAIVKQELVSLLTPNRIPQLLQRPSGWDTKRSAN
jgi:hypothetical protein